MHSSFQSMTLVNTISSKMMNNIVQKAYNSNEYEKIYRKRAVTLFEKRALDLFVDEIRKEHPRILDLGCGTGKPYDEYLVQKECFITGVDFCKKHIQMAKRNVPKATYVCEDFMNYCEDVLYDGIMLLYSLFHVHRTQHKLLLQNIYSRLTKQGIVLLNIRKKDSGNIKYKSNFCGKPMVWSNYDINTFCDIATDIGFKQIVLGDEKDFGSKESIVWIILTKS